MSQTVTLCPRLVFVSIVAPVLGNNECFTPGGEVLVACTEQSTPTVPEET